MNTTITPTYHHRGIYIRVTKDRQSKYKKVINIERKFWDGQKVKTVHPNHFHINHLIGKEIAELQKRVVNLETLRSDYEVRDILEPEKRYTLMECVLHYRDAKRREGQNKTADKYVQLAKLIDEVGDIDIRKADDNYARKVLAALEARDSVKSKATIEKYFRSLKTVLRHEINKGSITHSNIFNMKVTAGRSHKERLTYAEFQQLLSVDVDFLILTRDAFAAMVYGWGPRIGDFLRWQPEHIQDGKIHYHEQKTGKTKTIHILPQLAALIDKYRYQSRHYVFPLLRRPPDTMVNDAYRSHVESCTAVFNRNLKKIASAAGIDKRITSHTARHTFASWAVHAGIDLHMIKDMLNHSSIQVTENYIKTLNTDEDMKKAAERVFDR